MRVSRFNRPNTPLVAAICVGVLVLLAAIVIGAAPDTGAPSAGPAPQTAEDAGPDIEFAPVGDEEALAPSGGPDASPTAFPTPAGSPTATRTGTPTRTPVPATGPTGTAPKPSPSAGAAPTTAGPSRQTFTALAGYHCPQDAAKGFTRLNRWVVDDLTGWYSVSKGAWTSDGCDGAFDTLPMNGSATKVDYSHYFEWWFSTGTATRTCDLTVYIPVPLRPTESRGNPAYYEIRDTSTSAVRAVRTVSQVANQGRWVSLGTHAVNGGMIRIRLRNQGADPNNEHLSAAAVRAVCHG